MPTRRGSIRLFRLLGIDVYLHWSWAIIALYQIQSRQGHYGSIVWTVLEYLTLFGIVLTHEFGHALACRSVGGTANLILLWPLGGVAYVSPPRRPGATLWSIAAGPLVNVILVPVFLGLWYYTGAPGWSDEMPDWQRFILSLNIINGSLLVFNMLPFYPLDGGQILRSLLWFFMGRARSLVVASALGFVGCAGMVALAVWLRSPWTGVLAAFVVMRCWRGLRSGLALAKIDKLPRRAGFACPGCHSSPPAAALWGCRKCGSKFDTFETLAACPGCGQQFNVTQCIDCGAANPLSTWVVAAPATGPAPPRIG